MATGGIAIPHHGSLSEEEKNCMKFYILTTKLGTQAVRLCFNKTILPRTLATFLTKHSAALKGLKQKKVLNKKQIDTMYPAPGITVSSTDFDVTLMICIIRQTKALPSPILGWDALPPSGEITEEADLARIKYYRNNFLSHLSVPELAQAVYNDACRDIIDAINRLSGGILASVITEVTTSDIVPAEQRRILQELQNEIHRLQCEHEEEIQRLKKAVPSHIREQQKLIIQTWETEDENIVETRASTFISKESINRKCVTIVGNSGAGKSAIAYHVAIQLQSRGYTVLPVNTVAEIQMYGDSSKKQIFVLDDPIGKEGLDIYKLATVESYNNTIETLLQASEIKIIFTCRKQVVNDSRFKIGKTILRANLIDLHDNSLSLTQIEKKQMLVKHTLKCNVQLSRKTLEKITYHQYTNFPLLCRLFRSNEHYQKLGESFFTDTFPHLVDELKCLQHNEKLHFCSLVLCMMYDNDFDITQLDVFSSDVHQKLPIVNILEACGLPTGTSRKEIESAMERLTDVYLIKEGTRYRFIHDTLNEATAYLFGKEFPGEVITHCTPSFIREHIAVSESNEEKCVIIQPCDYHILSDRLSSEIQKGNFYEVFLNAFMQDERFVSSFVQYLGKLSESQLRKMMINSSQNIDNYSSFFESTAEAGTRTWYIYSMLKGNNIKAIHWVLGQNIPTLFYLCFTKLKLFELANRNDLSLIPMACLGGNVDVANLLLNDGNNGSIHDVWDTSYDCSITSLHLAIMSANPDMVRLVIKHGVNVNIVTQGGRTPLYVASALGLTNVCQLLISNKADINRSNNENVSPLYIASQNGHTDTVDLLLANKADINALISSMADINRSNNEYVSPLYIASQNGHTDTVDLLLENHSDINLCRSDGSSALHMAALNNHASVARLLLDHKADINTCDNDGVSPLISAILYGNMEMASLLLKHGADVNMCSNKRFSPLYTASYDGYTELAQLLLQNKAEINTCGYDGASPLYAAAGHGHTRTVSLLLSNNANVNMCNENNISPLSYAAQEGHMDTVCVLLDNKADVNLCRKDGVSPLCMAAHNGHTDIVRVLIQHKAVVNMTMNGGETPLWCAAQAGHEQTVKLLLDEGASVDMRKRNGVSPLFIAAYYGHYNIVQLLLQYQANAELCWNTGESPLFTASDRGHSETVKMLLEYGTNVNLCRHDGFSPVCIASQNGHAAIVDMLLQHKADVTLCTRGGISPLFVASKRGHTGVVEMLLQHKADVTLCARGGISPLFVASKQGHVGIVEKLLQHTGDINLCCTSTNESPLFAAASNGHSKTVRLLLYHGANVNLVTQTGLSPLFIASKYGHINVVELLIKENANVDQRCTLTRQSPLYVASENGHTEVVKLLLRNNADVKTRSKTGQMPEDIALRSGHQLISDLIQSHKLSAQTTTKRKWADTSL